MGVKGVKTLMIAGGGTGGHIYPAIAIAREYLARDASRKVIFVGTERGLEKTDRPEGRLPARVHRRRRTERQRRPRSRSATSARCRSASLQAWRIVGSIAPTSSSASAAIRPARCSSPRGCAASRRSSTKPTLFPASPTASLARFVTAVAVAFAEALPAHETQDGVVTGNPDPRRSSSTATTAQPRNREPQRLLVFGGSQGSRILNDAMTGALLFLARSKTR